MLKRYDDAEDVIQEAFARLAAASHDAIEDVRGWLVVVTRRQRAPAVTVCEPGIRMPRQGSTTR
jgi:DNA-directed RNA polymerase specialized sigma24 family protein